MKPNETKAPLPLFYSYARKDEPLRDKLEVHLKQLSREGLISGWHDRQILPGEIWQQEIDDNLEAASLILLLVSSDFLASDYCYDIEMQRALERDKRGEARVVPIILRPCDWQHAPFAHLNALPKDGKAISTWRNEDEALLNVAQGLRKLLEHTRPPAHALPKEQMENRARVIKRVRATWIDGMLAQALQQGTWLDVAWQEQPDALENPWDELVQEMKAVPHPLPPGTTIAQIYDQADGRLLLLGNPGAGKTLQLLTLTRTLLERAEQDTRQPLPVVFVLSSWARKRQPLEEWLVEELKVRYQVPQTIASRLVRERQILSLLDGLDEVAPQAQEACIQAINTYIQTYLEPKHVPLVLSCRSDDYLRLPTRANLQRAVSVLPLSDGQVEQYLQYAGQRVEALRQALHTDSNLAEMARTPLLLNIFMLTYMDSQLADLPLGLSQAEVLPILFSNYVRRMLNRRGLLRSTSKRLALAWLAFLARQMSRYNQTVFSIETLQVDGVSKGQERLYRISYVLQIGLLFFLVVGPPFALADIADKIIGAGTLPDEYFLYIISTGITTGLGLGILAGGCAALITLFRVLMTPYASVLPRARAGLTPLFSESDAGSWRIQPREILTWDWSWKNIRFGLICGFLAGPCIGLIAIFPPYGGVLLFFAVLLGILAIPLWDNLEKKLQNSPSGTQLLKRIRSWPWRTIRVELIWAFVALVLLLEIASAFIQSWNGASLEIALLIGLPVWLLASILKIATGERVMQRVHFRPNEGIKRSGRNGLVLWLAIAGSLVPSMAVASWLFYGTLISLAVWSLLIGAPIGLSLGLFFGLSAFLRHFTLRFWLWQLEYLPWKLASFLDEMVERLFLRRVGGSYLFIHRFLLDYFTDLTPSRQATLVASFRAGEAARPRETRRQAFRPVRIFSLKRLALLFVVLCLLATCTLIAIPARIASTISSDEHATSNAQAIIQATEWQALLNSEVYPANFPGHGHVALVTTLQKHDWELPPTVVGFCEPRKDGFHVFQTTPQATNVCAYNSIASDIAIRVDMTILQGDCGGILFRADLSQGTGYLFYLCANHTYGLLKDTSHSTSVNLIAPTVLSSGPHPTSSLAIAALGSTISLFLNGQQLAGINDDAYAMQSAAGLVAQARQQATEVLYHNLRAWRLSA